MEPEAGTENCERERVWKTKRENNWRGNIPSFPQVQCISITPETELEKREGGIRRKRKGEVRKEDA